MADPITVVGLISSIASLVDISAKVVSRLQEFTSKCSDIPKSFRALPIRLHLLTATLQSIQSRAGAGNLSGNVADNLKAVADDTVQRVSTLQTCLQSVVPPTGSSKRKRALKAFQSLAKDDKIQRMMREIDKNINILEFHQTNRLVDSTDCISAQITELTLRSKRILDSVGKDELLSLARTTGKTIVEELAPQTHSLLSNSNRILLFRFSQLPITAQKKFISDQEEQLRQFVEQEEAKLFKYLDDCDTRKRLTYYNKYKIEGTCDWVYESQTYKEWLTGKRNCLWINGDAGTGKTFMTAFITETLANSLGTGDALAIHACSILDGLFKGSRGILCALAGQIARASPTSMAKCKKFLETHVSNGQLWMEVLELQDLIVEMSLSSDIKRIFIVIDGLDEVGMEESILMAIVDIPTRARKVKMLITSRSRPTLAKALLTYPTLAMYSTDSHVTDLGAFVDQKLMQSKFADADAECLRAIKERIARTTESCRTYVLSLLATFHRSETDQLYRTR